MEMTKKGSVMNSVIIGLKLLLICAVIAGVVSFVYALTLQTYKDNVQQTKNIAIGKIFGKENLVCETVGDSSVYTVRENGELIGYCVETIGKGFGGDIQLMVGYTTGQKIIAVEVIGHSESPAQGGKMQSAEYLATYQGHSGELSFGNQVDKIAGASFSSKGVLEGVNAATKALQTVLEGGAGNE